MIDSISRGNDYYLVNTDFPLYCDAQEQVNEAYRDQRGWLRRCVFSIARSGIFSSDRTILQYAKEIWNVVPVRRPGPATVSVAELSNKGLVPPGVKVKKHEKKKNPEKYVLTSNFFLFIQEELGVSPATLHLPLVRMESMDSPSVPKYSSVAQSIEVGFDPSTKTSSTDLHNLHHN